MTIFHGLSVQILSVKSLRPLFAQLELPSAAMRGLASEIRHARLVTSSSLASSLSSSSSAAAAAQTAVKFTDWMLSDDVLVNGAFSQAMRDIVSVLSHKEECLVCMQQPTFWASMAELFNELHVSCLPLEHNRFFDTENSLDRDDHPFHTSTTFCRQIIQSTLVLCCHALPLSPPPLLSYAIRSAIESHVVPLCASAAAAAYLRGDENTADATARVVGGAGAVKTKRGGISAPGPQLHPPSRHRLAHMLPMHLLLGSLLQILGRTEHQHQNSSAAPVTSYRCSTARWLHELFEVQQRGHPQTMPVSPWNAFMRQLFRFFAGLAELQVLMLLLHIAHDVHLHCLRVPPFLVPCSAKYGNSTVAAGGYRCALSAATPQSTLPTLLFASQPLNAKLNSLLSCSPHLACGCCTCGPLHVSNVHTQVLWSITRASCLRCALWQTRPLHGRAQK